MEDVRWNPRKYTYFMPKIGYDIYRFKEGKKWEKSNSTEN